TVLHDLWMNGEVPDPFYERNSLLVEWVPERTWLYRKAFTVDESWKGSRVRLHFKGVDYAAQFFLNGTRLGEHVGMYTPAEFEVGGLLHYGGDNLLAVVIEKAPDEQPQVSKTSYVRAHKSRMTYWWDFCPRMIHQGIWDDVYLEATGAVAIEDVYIRPQLQADMTRADLSVTVSLSSTADIRAEVRTAIRYEGREIAAHRSVHALAAGETTLNACIPLERPHLWQPNGSGDACLYEAVVEAVLPDEESSLSAARRTTFGIRKVEFAPNETADPEAKPYTLVVNGRKTYIKGWNWVPLDVMYGVERPEKLERLLSLARRAGVNMLRVWGGGLIEKDAFYELCNRYGIMVWQEFIQSSSGIANKPSTDPEFLAMMEGEAERIIPRKRNHPSLVLWCGGNELQDGLERPLDDSEPVLGLLSRTVRRLHPGALWLATSPTGRVFSNSFENIANDPDGLHDVHGPWEHQGLTRQYELYNQGTSLMHSEFGVEGMTHLNTLNKTISKEFQWPASKDNPVYFHRGAWWINEPLVQQSFGGSLTDVAQLIRASQYLQLEGLRYAVESNLRRKWRNSGTLPWQFNEPFPNAYCTSALDYYAQPKPAYYGVARAYRDVSVTAVFAAQALAGHETFRADLWATSSLPYSLNGLQAEAMIIGASGRKYASGRMGAVLGANASAQLGSFECPLADVREEVFFLSLELTDESGTPIAANRYAFSKSADLTPMLRLPQTSLQVTRRAAGTAQAGKDAAPAADRWLLEMVNTGETAAFQVQLRDARPLGASGYAYFADSDFSLLPGEACTIAVDWSGFPEREREVEVSAWNAAAQTIKP
ncbi:glycoside hydrolase family 2 protein, partial [Gordoniibacillus kamchatkensis]|uniref:glycoside hydrolase family 2 protein n=1 Tax=Gordoniibacillus kamchatkensis TaxID=1590651 RepID=UPI0006974F47